MIEGLQIEVREELSAGGCLRERWPYAVKHEREMLTRGCEKNQIEIYGSPKGIR